MSIGKPDAEGYRSIRYGGSHERWIISANTVYSAAVPPTTSTATTTPASLGYGPGTEYAYLTSEDVAVLEKATGTTSLEQLDSVEPGFVSGINTQEKYGDFNTPGQSLAESFSTYYLTSADVALFERATGTTNLVDALRSSPGAAQVIQDVGWDRQSGALTGPLTAKVLQGYLANYEQAANQGPAYERADIAADVAFLKQAVASISPNSLGVVDTLA